MADRGRTPYYFPAKDADVGPWIHNFMLVLSANATRWGIAEALVTALGVLATAFWDAYTRRMLPDSGKVSVEQKNLALKALKKGVQDMVNGHINHNPAVTSDDRVALGMYVYRPKSGLLPDPETTVVLRAVPGLVRQVVVHFTDSATPEKRGKPYGVEAAELACGVLPAPPGKIEDLPRWVTASRSPATITFREEDRGKTVYLAGHWKGTRQQDGPWSGIITAIVP
jgi:hypothetical protein